MMQLLYAKKKKKRNQTTLSDINGVKITSEFANKILGAHKIAGFLPFHLQAGFPTP